MKTFRSSFNQAEFEAWLESFRAEGAALDARLDAYRKATGDLIDFVRETGINLPVSLNGRHTYDDEATGLHMVDDSLNDDPFDFLPED